MECAKDSCGAEIEKPGINSEAQVDKKTAEDLETIKKEVESQKKCINSQDALPPNHQIHDFQRKIGPPIKVDYSDRSYKSSSIGPVPKIKNSNARPTTRTQYPKKTSREKNIAWRKKQKERKAQQKLLNGAEQ